MYSAKGCIIDTQICSKMQNSCEESVDNENIVSTIMCNYKENACITMEDFEKSLLI